MITFWRDDAPHGRSSWPRCRQVFANACRTPSSSLVSGIGNLVAAPDAQPAAAEEIALLPFEDGGIGIGRRRQHPALAERLERLGDSGRVERSRRRALRADDGLRSV